MDPTSGEEQAIALMTRFVERTGVVPGPPPRRYLWTDAFAVCNLLGLARSAGRPDLAEQARALVHQVHHVLGRHRADDPRTGWIGGLEEAEGEAHPTRGGLRIGKGLPERAPGEPLDPDAEWDRDGQYFHYLTKWMHALEQLARATGDPTPHRWACELAVTAHRGFVVRPGAPRRMIWKASVDLSRALVPSMGHHDPLDGLVTCLELGASPLHDARLGAEPVGGSRGGAGEVDLGPATADFAALVSDRDLVTDDPLGLGGLLTDAHRLAQLTPPPDGAPMLVARLLAAAREGLEMHLATRPLDRGPSRRLAFRELGLAIGLHAAERMASAPGWLDAVKRVDARPAATARTDLEHLVEHAEVAPAIEAFWIEHQASPSFLAHEDIDAVMLATSLAPDGALILA